MSNISKVAVQLKNTEFLTDLLQEFVVRGLGSLPGRETTIAVVGLLLKHHPEWQDNPPQDYEIARLLRTSPRKIRNIRDEIGYRDSERDEEWCQERLIEILGTAERLSDKKYISFQIDDGLIKDYTKKLVRENYGVVEQGLNASIVRISGESFVALVLAVMPEEKRELIISEIPQENLEERQDKHKSKTPIRLFVEGFATKSGEKAGEESAKLAFTLLTGGFNQIDNALDIIKEIFRE